MQETVLPGSHFQRDLVAVALSSQCARSGPRQDNLDIWRITMVLKFRDAKSEDLIGKTIKDAVFSPETHSIELKFSDGTELHVTAWGKDIHRFDEVNYAVEIGQ